MKKKLTTLKPRIATLGSKVQALTARSRGVERKRGSAGVRDRTRIKERDSGLCQKCLAEERVSIGVVVDHKVPLWAGGSDSDDNKWLLCDPCHDEKTAREARERAAGSCVTDAVAATAKACE